MVQFIVTAVDVDREGRLRRARWYPADERFEQIGPSWVAGEAELLLLIDDYGITATLYYDGRYGPEYGPELTWQENPEQTDCWLVEAPNTARAGRLAIMPRLLEVV